MQRAFIRIMSKSTNNFKNILEFDYTKHRTSSMCGEKIIVMLNF